MSRDFQLDSHKLQYHPDRVADFLAGRTVWPLYVEVSPTSVCNHRCRFCNFNYLGHVGKYLPEGRMPRLMEEFATAGIKAVVFAGAGEPSLHPDTFPSLRRANEMGVDVAMSTNGVLLSDDQTRQMAELLTWTRFSINGGTPASYEVVQGANPGDMGKALANVERLAGHKKRLGSSITIGSQCVLTPENRDTIAALAAQLKACGAEYFSIKHFYPHEANAYQPDISFLTPSFVAELGDMAAALSDESFRVVVRDRKSLERLRPYTMCRGLPFIAYVREDGMLYTCFSHQEDAATAIGDIVKHDFTALWNSDGRKEAIDRLNLHYDKKLCQANCRHHQINIWLEQLAHPPAHVNFI